MARDRAMPPPPGRPHGRQILLLIPPKLCETCPAMKRNGHIRKYAAEQGIAEEEALKKGMEEKFKEFAEKGSELYAKA